MTYAIKHASRVVEEDIPHLPKTMQGRIQQALLNRLAVDPQKLGKPLRYHLAGARSLCIGDYRVIFTIDAATKVVYIWAIKHRKEVYEKFAAIDR